MKKLELRLDELSVESFDTAAGSRNDGTVVAHDGDTEGTCLGPGTCNVSCNVSCNPSCNGGDTCNETCGTIGTCNGSCGFSCARSCYGTCYPVHTQCVLLN